MLFEFQNRSRSCVLLLVLLVCVLTSRAQDVVVIGEGPNTAVDAGAQATGGPTGGPGASNPDVVVIGEDTSGSGSGSGSGSEGTDAPSSPTDHSAVLQTPISALGNGVAVGDSVTNIGTTGEFSFDTTSSALLSAELLTLSYLLTLTASFYITV